MTQHKTKTNWLLPLAIIIVVAVIVMVLISMKPTPPIKPQAEKAWTIKTEVLKLESRMPQVDLLGSVEARNSGQLTAALNADVDQVPAREGQHVKKGDVLVRLDDKDISLQVQQRQAEVESIESQINSENVRYQSDLDSLKKEKQLLDIASRDLRRQKKLVSSNLASEEKIDNSQTRLSQQALAVTNRESSIADHPNRLKLLQANLQKARAALEAARINLERTRITAPFDGIITGIAVSPGDRVRNGQQIISLYDGDSIEIRAQIPQKYVARIQPAVDRDDISTQSALKAETVLYGQHLMLRLDRLSGQINAGTGGVDGLFSPVLSDDGTHRASRQALIIGTAVKLRLNLPEMTAVFSAPLSAVYGTNRIYTVTKNRLTAVDINIIGDYFDQQDKQRVLFRSKKLKPGDKINITQLPNAISGLKVTEMGSSKQTRQEASK